MTLKEALRLYFEENGFAADGGYGAAWVDFSLGPIPFPFPNTRQRKAAVRFHDLHHLVTEYRTDFRGELEISAWEIGSGCRNQSAAWVLNLGGMGGGMVLAPLRSLRAFVRGRNSDNFYGESYNDQLLATPVVEARRRLRIDDAAGARIRTSDVALFAAASLGGLALGLVLFTTLVPVAIIAGPVLWALRARAS